MERKNLVLHNGDQAKQEVKKVEVGTKYKILSIDEEREVQYFLKKKFLQNGYKFYTARDGKEGMVQLANTCPDLVLLDLILPDMDGIDLIRRMRQLSDCPLIVVSSKEREQDKVSALDAGADDYVTKPFGSEELLARIRCALRFRKLYGGQSSYQRKELQVDFEKRIVLLQGEQVHMTPVEYRIMEYLARNSGKMITYQMLLEKIWGPYASGNNKILRVNMTNIRRKIGDNPAEPKYIFTEAGVGYRMAESSE
ncbi:MAG: response regulator transcription factor [Eubacterium sp.]|nr:response regulator transcription factor [Eubacterium sp.]